MIHKTQTTSTFFSKLPYLATNKKLNFFFCRKIKCDLNSSNESCEDKNKNVMLSTKSPEKPKKNSSPKEKKSGKKKTTESSKKKTEKSETPNKNSSPKSKNVTKNEDDAAGNLELLFVDQI